MKREINYEKSKFGRFYLILRKYHLLILLLPLLLPKIINASNSIEEKQRVSDVTWSGNVTVDTLCIIYPGQTLFIEPGTVITFTGPDKMLTVYGRVEAYGTPTEPITFKGLDNQSYWKGIDIISGTSPSEFLYCEFYNIQRNESQPEYFRAECGIDISYTDDVKFQHCTFKDMKDGIGVMNSSNLLIENCTIKNNNNLNPDKGFISLELNTSAAIRFNTFNNNICNSEGLIKILNGCYVQIISNNFSLTQFSSDKKRATFPVILAENNDYANQVIINSNKFVGTTASLNSEIQEVKISGINYKPDSSNVFLWNNEFSKHPFIPNEATVQNINAIHTNISITHNKFHDFTNGAIRLNYCDARIMLNSFETEATTKSAISLGTYSNQSLTEDIHNEITGNTFTNITVTGESGGVISSEIYPREDITVSTRIENNYFNNNKSYHFDDNGEPVANGGAAIYDRNNSYISIENNLFENNTAYIGGTIVITNEIGQGINGNDGLAIIANNDIIDNEADSLGGAIYIDSASVIIERNLISGNESMYGGGIYLGNLKNSVVQNNTVHNNIALCGAGVFIKSSYTDLDPVKTGNNIYVNDNSIAYNEYSFDGGGLYVDSISSEVDSLWLMRNMVYFNINPQNAEDARGGGLFVNHSKNVQLINCNFFSNAAGYENACIYVNSDPESSISIVNCNLVNHVNEGGIYLSPNSSPDKTSIFNTIFAGNNNNAVGKGIMYENSSAPITTSNCYFDILPLNYDVNNIDFVQAITPEFVSLSDFHLQCENSVCVDAGHIAVKYNDILSGLPDPIVLPPSCGNERNDVGVSGGPYTRDNDILFYTQPPAAQLEFVVKVIDPEQRIVSVSVENPPLGTNDDHYEYRFTFGDGNFTEYQNLDEPINFEYQYNQTNEHAKITLFIIKNDTRSCLSHNVSFSKQIVNDATIQANPNYHFKDSDAGGKSEASLENGISLFPNPTSGILNIRLSSSFEYDPANPKDADVEIFNINGIHLTTLKYTGPTLQAIDLGQYGKGMFLIKINIDAKSYTRKIWVN